MSHTLIRNFAAIVLLVAAGLKAHQLATEPFAGVGLLDSRWFLIAAVEFELLFGLWLLSGILPKSTWFVALGCFGVFTCISLYNAISGSASCGCFGRVLVNPWYTAVFDLAIVASLLRWRPTGQELAAIPLFKGSHFVPPRLQALAVLAVWFVIGVPAAFAMCTYSATTLSDVGDITGDGQIVVLEPEKWIGKRFPLLEFIDIGERLDDGECLVVVYRHGCPKCTEVIREYEEFAQRSATDPVAPQVALIEVPPYVEGNERPVPNARLVLGRLTNRIEWFVATPLQIALKAGAVVNVKGQAK